MKHTAIEWLFQKLWDEPKDKLTWYGILEKAKAMHKEEIENAVKYGCSDWGSAKDAEHYYNETFKNQREMKIELKAYDHTCADGCCYTTGYDVFIDGEKIGSTIGDYAYQLVEILNEYFNTKEK